MSKLMILFCSSSTCFVNLSSFTLSSEALLFLRASLRSARSCSILRLSTILAFFSSVFFVGFLLCNRIYSASSYSSVMRRSILVSSSWLSSKRPEQKGNSSFTRLMVLSFSSDESNMDSSIGARLLDNLDVLLLYLLDALLFASDALLALLMSFYLRASLRKASFDSLRTILSYSVLKRLCSFSVYFWIFFMRRSCYLRTLLNLCWVFSNVSFSRLFASRTNLS